MRGRKERFTIRNSDAKATKLTNRVKKTKERARRDARVVAAIKKAGNGPYAPVLVSWMCRKLDKAAYQLTPADVKKLVG